MITEDQSEVVSFLESPATHGGTAVERVDTHASIVFLAGSRAWKLKRAVRYDYLDFSTAARRKAMCEAELRLNRRTAPALYRAVVPVTRDASGALTLGGRGAPVDWVVEMARFDQAMLFDRLAARGALDLALMAPLAIAIARLHHAAQPRADHGGRAGMAWVIDGNAAGFAEQGGGVLDPAACARVTAASLEALERGGALLDRRRESGFVRECHGDLHLRNVVLLDDSPTLFDGVEFNDDISCIDVLYDLAFLVMDLWHRGLHAHASDVWNAYLGETGAGDGLRLMPLFLSCRAAVRAKTNATAAAMQDDAGRRRELEEAARGYISMAERLLAPRPAVLVAIGGFSGSGKSSLARAIAPALGRVPGAVVVRSDVIRKRLRGVEPTVRLGADGYAPDVSRQVYAAMRERASGVTRDGYAAIADAVFARESDRAAIEQAASAAGVRFVGLWLDAPEETLLARVRERKSDASDADAAVVRTQLARKPGPIAWQRIDASRDIEHVAERALQVVAG
jgi:aminoglycoside phosphotransferase family enzyme/predicted kinase